MERVNHSLHPVLKKKKKKNNNNYEEIPITNENNVVASTKALR